jgi:hypothetical protein
MALPRITLPPGIVQLLGPEAETPDKREGSTKRPHISFSQLSMYLRCSMQYYFRYILGLKDKPKVSLSIGLGGHAALEWNTKRKIEHGTDAPAEQIVQKASDFMDHYLRELPESEYEKDVEPGATKDKFLGATRVFATRDAPKIVPISAELEFNLDLNEYLPEPLPEPIRIVNGKIDLVATDTSLFIAPENVGPVEVDDYKLVTRKRTQDEVNLSPQLTLYNTVIRKITGKWPSKTGYRMLTPGNTREGPDATALMREPQYMKPEAQESRLRRLVYQFAKAEHGIRQGVFIPTDNPITCSWCGYRNKCQASLVDDFEAAAIRAKT